MKKIKFKFKNNYYIRKLNGEYLIRSIANVDGCGYSWFKVLDESVIECLDDFLEGMDG